MISSTDRIITSHVGSLPRPAELLKLIQAKAAGRPYDREELATVDNVSLLKRSDGMASPTKIM
jgi:methionine synthase II (cobalamin-independent)